MISGKETVGEIINRWPQTRAVFINNGFPNFSDDQILNRVGSFIRLNTLAKSQPDKINQLISLLNETVEGDETNLLDLNFQQSGLTLVGLLPCGLKVPMQRAIEGFAERNIPGAKLIIEGNVYHEISYYEYIEKTESVDELPELILSADINSFYHQRFRDKFLATGAFEKLDMPVNDLYQRSGLVDPEREFTVIATNALVIVADHTKLGSLPVPSSWEDLLNPVYEGKITLRGDDRFFCSAVLVPFMKLWGEEGLQALARNTLTGKHPAQMVKVAGTGRKDGSAISVMPQFFANRIKKQENISIVIPEEGPLASPVTLFMKAGAGTNSVMLKNYLLYSKELASVATEAYHYPVINAESMNKPPAIDRLCWIGWDYIREKDLAVRKREASDCFYKYYQARV